MKDLTKIVSRNLSMLRKARGITQGQLAERFSYSDKSISKWETGEGLPDLETLSELASFYGVTIDFLITEHPEDVLAKQGEKDPKDIRRNKWIISVLGVVFIWTVAVVVYCGLLVGDVQGWQNWMVFVWAVPASFLMAILFSHRWGKRAWTLAFSICSVWTIAAALYLELGFDIQPQGWNMWFIWFTPIPAIFGLVLLYRAQLDKMD